MIYQIDKSIILEATSLLQEEMSPMVKNGLKVGALGAGVGLAHAGTFGTGVASAVDGIGSAIKGGATNIGASVGTELTRVGKVFGAGAEDIEDDDDTQAKVDHKVHAAEEKVAASHIDATQPQHESSLGMKTLAGIGAAGVVGAAGYGALKAKDSQAYHNLKGGLKGHQANKGHESTMRNVGLGANKMFNTTKSRLGNAGKALAGRI
jgi:hypothetical protein